MKVGLSTQLLFYILSGLSWQSGWVCTAFDTTAVLHFEKLGSIKTYEPDGSYRQDSKPFAEIIKYQQLWLRVVYEIFPINVEPKVDGKYRFGKKLRNRWRQFGDLWLDNVPSEPIPINLHAAEKD